MLIKIIPQFEFGSTTRKRTGDLLNSLLENQDYDKFRFAVAFMRLTGLNRLADSIRKFCDRGGVISGVIGIDQGITSFEALKAIKEISETSTILHTVSGFIFHPKCYILSGEEKAVIIIGSPNLTRDGLFRNIELSISIHLDLEIDEDQKLFTVFNDMMDDLLDYEHPNIHLISEEIINQLLEQGKIKKETSVPEPGPIIRKRRKRTHEEEQLADLFPPIKVPIAPPPIHGFSLSLEEPEEGKEPTFVTFILQLSAFDSSHRTGVPGTAEILIPKRAIGFFPPLSLSDRKYPDCYFKVLLHTPDGAEVHRYRLWYYEHRPDGSRIDEHRLRMNKETIDLTTPDGGDLLIFRKLLDEADQDFELTIISRRDPSYQDLLELCTLESQGKKFGLIYPFLNNKKSFF